MKLKFRIYRSPDGGEGNGGASGGDPAAGVQINHQAPAGAPAYTPPSIAIMDAAPPEYREKPYMKSIKDIPGLFKEVDTLYSKLGQRPTVGAPGPDAKPEEIKAFYDGLAPKDAKEYVFPETEISKKTPRDEKFVEGFKSVLKASGISPYQAAQLFPKAEAFLNQFVAGARDQQDEAFETEIKNQFGDQLEPSMKAAKGLIADNVPKELLPRLEKMTNDDLLLMTVMAKNIHDKYIKEDGVHRQGGQSAGAGDAEAIRKEAYELQKTEAYKDFRHPDHEATVKKVSELYQRSVGLGGLK